MGLYVYVAYGWVLRWGLMYPDSRALPAPMGLTHFGIWANLIIVRSSAKHQAKAKGDAPIKIRSSGQRKLFV